MSDASYTVRPLTEQYGGLRTPYDLTVEPSHPYRMELAVAAFALTKYRWTAESEAVIAVTERNADGADVIQAVRVQVDDQATIDDFLQAIRTARNCAANGGQAIEGGDVDLVIASDHADLRSGEVRFVIETPDSSGFVADVAAAVTKLASGGALLEDVRCIAPERRQLLDAVVGAKVRIVDIDTLFLEQVQSRPQQVAARDAQVELTYEELSQAADRYADTLFRAGVRPGDRVLVAIRRSVAEVVALLATIRLGAAYAGFDEDDPEARARQMIGKLAPTAVVVEAATVEHSALREHNCVDAWSPDTSAPADAKPVLRPAGQNDPNSAAFVAFTSGTTGEPKGVVIRQKSITRLALSPEIRMQPGDHVMRMAPLAFDTSQFEIWGTLLNGATLEVFPAKLPSIGKLEAFFIERKISVVWLTAGLFRLIAKSRPEAFAGLRWIVTGGEVVPYDSAASMLDMHPGLVITNGYGPTENATFTTTYTVRSSAEIDGPLPVGWPIAGTKVFVLDRNARLLPPGAIGELYAAGLGLAAGYLNDEIQTNGRFGCFCPDVDDRLYRTGDLVRLDPNGNVLFLGRADKQIKLNGYRIELEAIGVTLAGHPDVRDAVIIVSRQPGRETRLVAAVAAQSGAAPDPRTLREYLTGFLPSYAIPLLWAVVDEIPITRNGKVAEQILIEAAVPVARAERKP